VNPGIFTHIAVTRVVWIALSLDEFALKFAVAEILDDFGFGDNHRIKIEVRRHDLFSHKVDPHGKVRSHPEDFVGAHRREFLSQFERFVGERAHLSIGELDDVGSADFEIAIRRERPLTGVGRIDTRIGPGFE
jgi:hypothetical protein